MAENVQPPVKLEILLPRPILDQLTAAASSRGEDVDALAAEWLHERLIHEQEKQEGIARKVRRP
jgi:hypothetical protein